VSVIYATVTKTIIARENTVKPVSTECQPICYMWTDSHNSATEHYSQLQEPAENYFYRHVTGPNRSRKQLTFNNGYVSLSSC
jgi:hypothetical protein